MWGETFDDFENEEQELAVAKQNLMSEPARADFTFSKLPLGIQPVDFMKTHFAETAGKSMQFRKGTTTLAFVYEPATPNDKGGIIVAVDSRASSGEYISSKSVRKIFDINDRMVATMAGGAADCQFWTRIVAKYCTLYELREKNSITVSAASKYFDNYGYGGQGSMVAGWLLEKGPQIFKVDSEDDRCQLKVCSVGSGSLNAYGILDNHYKPKMTDEEARKSLTIMSTNYSTSGSGGYLSTGQTSQFVHPNTQMNQMPEGQSSAPPSHKMKSAIDGFLWKTIALPDTTSSFVFANEVVKLPFSVSRVANWLPESARFSSSFSTATVTGSSTVEFVSNTGKDFKFNALLSAPSAGIYRMQLKLHGVVVATADFTVLESVSFLYQISPPLHDHIVVASSGFEVGQYQYYHAGMILQRMEAPLGTSPPLYDMSTVCIAVPNIASSHFVSLRIYSTSHSKYYAGYLLIPRPHIDDMPYQPIVMKSISPQIEWN
ncbi:unnamed protein product [Caenorhabditis nigoni]